MERRIFIFSVLAGLLFSIIVPARELPTLSADKKITLGTLPSGISYYIVNNPTDNGYADMALVRRGEIPDAQLRSETADVAEFFSRRGVGFRREGMFSGYDGGTVFRFDRTPVSDLDSALLYTFTLAGRSRNAQAVVVSGNIDPKTVLQRMEVFSLMVPKVHKTPLSTEGYVWEGSPAALARKDTAARHGFLQLEYSAPRVPAAQMNTAQALVNDIFARELLTIVRGRLERNLRKAGLPYGSLVTDHVGSDETAFDERYVVRVETDRVEEALGVCSSTISALNESGALYEEFRDAKRIMLHEMLLLGKNAVSNSEYVDRCVSAFLFGGSLAPFSEEVKLFAMKNVSDTTELRLFNHFTRAILSDRRNLRIEYGGCPIGPDKALDVYLNTPSVEENGSGFIFSSADTLGLPSRFPRVKIKDEKPDALTGGVAWTFSNGMRVLYKRIRGSGMFDYAFYLGGGYGSVKGLREGEGGWFAPLASLMETGGLGAGQLRNMLQSNGIEMDFNVSATGMDIRGSAPYYKLPLLLRSLISLSMQHSVNMDDFEYFRSCRRISSAAEDIDATLYKVLCPGFALSPHQSVDVLDETTLSHALDYFNERFSHCADGVLVLVGDLDETLLRKALCKHLGGFSTERGASSRQSVSYKPRSGKSIYMKEGEPQRVELLLTADYPFTSAGYFASLIAGDKLRRALVQALYPEGVSVDVSMEFTTYPEERLWCRISVLSSDPAGLPDGCGPADMTSVITIVRKTLSSLSSRGISESELKAGKDNLLLRFRQNGTAEEAISNVLTRYALGKNIMSGYSATIGTINAARIREILSSLENGGRIEYIVR